MWDLVKVYPFFKKKFHRKLKMKTLQKKKLVPERVRCHLKPAVWHVAKTNLTLTLDGFLVT